MPLTRALELSREADLDLVEVAPDSSPPTMIGSLSINAPMYLKPTGVS